MAREIEFDSAEAVEQVMKQVRKSVCVDTAMVTHAIVAAITNHDAFTGGCGVEDSAVDEALEEIDEDTWADALDALSEVADAAAREQAKEFALRLIRALAASATKHEATPAA